MEKYWLYFKYILEHKKNVFVECRKTKGMWWRGITHDLSKFLPCEFVPYTKKFYGGSYEEEEFQKALEHHYKNNSHHWNYYNGEDMDYKDIQEMICDWKAMAKKFNSTAQEFYLKNYKKMNLSWNTRMYIELILDLNFSEAHGYGHTMEKFAEMYNEEDYNNYFGWIKEKYGIDTYKMFNEN